MKEREVAMERSPRLPSPVGESDSYVLWDAAYILGSLSDADRREYEAHLRDCLSCRQSVDELSGLPALLGQLTEDEVAALDEGEVESGPALRAGSLTSPLAKAVRRRRAVRVAALTMAAALMVLGVLVGVGLHWGTTTSKRQADAASAPMTPVAPTELKATVTISGHDWGTQIDMNCTYPAEVSGSGPDEDEPPGKLAMVVVGRDGSHDRLATWMALEGVRATPTGSTSMPVDRIAAVEIVSADSGTTLLQHTV
jgi:hypothetical protein